MLFFRGVFLCDGSASIYANDIRRLFFFFLKDEVINFGGFLFRGHAMAQRGVHLTI